MPLDAKNLSAESGGEERADARGQIYLGERQAPALSPRRSHPAQGTRRGGEDLTQTLFVPRETENRSLEWSEENVVPRAGRVD
jgi:hypothetical protein